MAFGINESEATSREGESDADFTFPRILGIEAVGVIDAVGDGVDLEPGQKAATMMGGLGRSIDGSYAEYTVVDAVNVIPFETSLPWDIVGALPEMVQTAHGALTTALQLRPGQSVLVHGGTSTVGLIAIATAHQLGATVIATATTATRRSTQPLPRSARKGPIHRVPSGDRRPRHQGRRRHRHRGQCVTRGRHRHRGALLGGQQLRLGHGADVPRPGLAIGPAAVFGLRGARHKAGQPG